MEDTSTLSGPAIYFTKGLDIKLFRVPLNELRKVEYPVHCFSLNFFNHYSFPELLSVYKPDCNVSITVTVPDDYGLW